MKHLRVAMLAILAMLAFYPSSAGAANVWCADPWENAPLWTTWDDAAGDRHVDFSWEQKAGCYVDTIMRVYYWPTNGAPDVYTGKTAVLGWDQVKYPSAQRTLHVEDTVGGRTLLAEIRTTAGTRIYSAIYVRANGLIMVPWRPEG